MLGGDGLRERRVERRGKDEVDPVPDSALPEVPLGEERELERRDRALDRHVDEVDHDASAVEALERRRERRGSLRGIEGKGALVPAGAGEPLRLLRLQTRSRGDDEHVVGEDRAVVEQELVPLDPDRVDLSLVEDDAVSQLPLARPDDLVQRGEPEGDEEQPRLVDVAVVTVDDVDLGFVGVEAPAQPVGDHRAAGAAAQDDDPLARHRLRLSLAGGTAIRASSELPSGNYAQRPGRQFGRASYAFATGERECCASRTAP